MVKGLAGLLLKVIKGLDPADIAKVDLASFFNRLGFSKMLTVQRRTGFAALAQRIQMHARQAGTRRHGVGT